MRTGAVHSAEPVWANGRPTAPIDLRPGDEVDSFGHGRPRRACVKKTMVGQGEGTVWLHTASGACIRCLPAERVAVRSGGGRRYRQTKNVQIGDFLYRLVAGLETVDPVVAIRSQGEPVRAVYLTMPSVALLSEEGILCRPS